MSLKFKVGGVGMPTFQKFEDIDAWKKARELTKEIYKISNSGRFAKDFGLRDQIRKASISIMSNIAESFERGGRKEFIQFLSMAKGSAGGVRSHLNVAIDQTYLDKASYDHLVCLCEETSRLLSGLIKYLSQSNVQGVKYKSTALTLDNLQTLNFKL
jgi:four helix bundle protein